MRQRIWQLTRDPPPPALRPLLRAHDSHCQIEVEITPKQAQRLVLEANDDWKAGQTEPEITFDQFVRPSSSVAAEASKHDRCLRRRPTLMTRHRCCCCAPLTPQVHFISRKQEQTAERPDPGCCVRLSAFVCNPLVRLGARFVPAPARKCYHAAAWWAAWVSTHAYFDRVVFFCIIFVGIATAVQLSYPTDEPLPHAVATFLDLTQVPAVERMTRHVVVRFPTSSLTYHS